MPLFQFYALLLCKLVRVGCIAILLALGWPEPGSHTCNGIGFLNLESLGNSLSICVFKDLHFPVMVGIQGLMGRGQWFREGLCIFSILRLLCYLIFLLVHALARRGFTLPPIFVCTIELRFLVWISACHSLFKYFAQLLAIGTFWGWGWFMAFGYFGYKFVYLAPENTWRWTSAWWR